MSTEVRLRKGTDAQHATFTGALAETTVNTTKKALHVHDGSTAGGNRTLMVSELGQPSGVAPLDSGGNIPAQYLGQSGLSAFDSVAALKGANTNVITRAYLNVSGRDGLFAWKTGNYSAQITLDVQEVLYIKADAVAASAGAWVRQGGWAVEGVNVDWAAPAANGTTDDSAKVQAVASLGLNFNFGPKSYRFSNISLVTEHQRVSGCGRMTRLLDGHATNDLFVVGDGTNTIRGVNFRDFVVWTAAGITKTAGHVINARFATRLITQDVYCGTIDDYVANSNVATLWDGIYFDRFAEVSVRGGQFCLKNKGIKARGNIDSSFGLELTIDDNVRFVFCGSYAIHIGGGCGGVYAERVDVSNCLRGIQIDKALQNVANREIFISKSATFDTCSEWGMFVGNDGAALIQSDGWFCSNGTATSGGNAGGGVMVDTTTGGNVRIDMTGATIYNNRGDGIRALAGIWTITGCKIVLNGQGANGGCGFIAEGSGPTVATINGNSITNNGNATRGVGVQFAHASNDNYVVTGNDLRGNGIAGFSSAASPSYGVTKVVHNNIGFVTEARGRAAGTTDGSGDLTITHQMNGTPASITAQLSGAAFVGSIQPHTFNGTTFKLRFFNSGGSAMTGASVQGDWAAQL